MFRLDGKTILITGAARGIGAAIARLAAQAGGRVIGHASAPSTSTQALLDAGVIAPGDFLIEDLAAPQAGARLAAAAIDRAGRLDALVNNAGLYAATPVSGPVDDWEDGWRSTLAVNLKAPADLARAAIAHFRLYKDDGRGGRVINLASRAGHRGDGLDFAAYAASKGALLALTKTFARALAGENILFYALAPGWVETRMAPEDVAARAKAVAEIPLGRVAQPEEVAAFAVFLLSDACRSATGSTFDMNGASYVR
jgi:NAD(P)-dependent dehydrogenase (short-subunit alcohol dehydrogenase family)